MTNTHNVLHSNYIQVGCKAPVHGHQRVLQPNQGEIGFDWNWFWATQNIDVDNATLNLYNHLMNTEGNAAEMRNIIKGLKCAVTIASAKPTGMF